MSAFGQDNNLFTGANINPTNWALAFFTTATDQGRAVSGSGEKSRDGGGLTVQLHDQAVDGDLKLVSSLKKALEVSEEFGVQFAVITIFLRAGDIRSTALLGLDSGEEAPVWLGVGGKKAAWGERGTA